MKRAYGSGSLHIKSGAYYVRWRTPDGRHRNRRLGKVRTRGEKDGLTRAQAEREARRIIDTENDHPPVEPAEPHDVLHSVFALAMRNGWTPVNPVVDAARPRRRRAGDANANLELQWPGCERFDVRR